MGDGGVSTGVSGSRQSSIRLAAGGAAVWDAAEFSEPLVFGGEPAGPEDGCRARVDPQAPVAERM